MEIRIVVINITPYFSGYNKLVRNGLSKAMLLYRKPLPEIVSMNSTCPEIGHQLIKLIDLFDPHVMKNLYGEV